MDDIKEKIKQALRHIWINKYRLFFCLLTLCCLFGLVHYFKSADSATASISFNYSEAALGMNPNKTRFNAYEIVSDEVMKRAIRRVGLQDSLTASQLAQCLYLSPEGTGSANGSEYISTNYYLSINTRKLELGSRKATDLLQSVCESYREIFQSNYCDNQSLLKEKLEVTSACEPYLRLNELEGSGDKAQTTYDGLVLKLVSLEQQVAASQIDRQFQEEILQSFRNVDFGGTDEQHAAMESMINDYEAQLKSYYEIINTSSKELNLYISADYLKMISSVQVAAAINVKLYLMLALVLFFVIGCCGAVLLGRLSDVVDYLLYVDKKTGLPNREKLNVYITGMAGRILPEDYTCFALQLDNLTEMSRRFGYTVGDGILKDFSGLVQLMGDTDGTVGYNGAGKFLAFFDECSSRKAEVMIRILQSQVDEYNKLNPEYPILFTAAWATTSEEELYHVRDLVRCAQKKMALTAEEGGAILGISET